MQTLLAMVFLLGTYALGIFCLTQIFGTIQNIKARGTGMSLLSIAMWVLVLAAVFVCVQRFIPAYTRYCIIGFGVAFFMMLRNGRLRR